MAPSRLSLADMRSKAVFRNLERQACAASCAAAAPAASHPTPPAAAAA